MTHRRRIGPGPSDIGTWVAADLRESAEMFYPVARDMGAGRDPAGWLRRADQLDAGEPVVLPGWEVANYIEGPHPAMVTAFRLEPNGSVTAMWTHG